MSRSIMEAISSGRPVICSNIHGCKEMVENNFNGFLVEPRDAISLAKSIEKLAFNKRLQKKFGTNSRKLVKEKFSANIISKNFLNVYLDLFKKVP